MDKFDDFIKKNTKFKSKQSQDELDEIKSYNKNIVRFNYKPWLGGLTLATSFALIFALLSSLNQPDIAADSVAEDYMFDVFLAVDDEINDFGQKDYDFL